MVFAPEILISLTATATVLWFSGTPLLAEGGHGSLRAKPVVETHVEETSTPQTSSKQSSNDQAVQVSAPHMVPELHSPKPEAPAVLEAVKIMAKAAARGDVDQYRACLDDACTVFDESSNTMLSGKDAATENMIKEFDRDKSKGKHRTVSIKIDEPFVKVAGNSAVVSYHGEKIITFDGMPPIKREAFITQVFIKEGDDWKLSSHTRGQWTEKVGK